MPATRTYLTEADHCPECKGTGDIHPTLAGVECPYCNGTGFDRFIVDVERMAGEAERFRTTHIGKVIVEHRDGEKIIGRRTEDGGHGLNFGPFIRQEKSCESDPRSESSETA